MICLFCSFFLYKHVYTPRALLGPITDFIVPGDKMQYSLYSLVFKVFVKIFGPSAKHQVYLYLIPSIKEFAHFFSLHLQIMLRCVEADPDFPHFRGVRFLICLPALFFFLIGPFAVVHYFDNRRLGGGRNFNNIEPRIFCNVNCTRDLYNTVVCPIIPNCPHGGGGYLAIYSCALCNQRFKYRFFGYFCEEPPLLDRKSV